MKKIIMRLQHVFTMSLCMVLVFALLLGCAHETKSSPKSSTMTAEKKLQVPRERANKLRIAVVGFDVATSTYGVNQANRKAEDMITSALIRTKQFQVIDRRHIQKVLDELKLQMSGMVDMATAVRIGKILGVHAIVTGSITEMGCSAASFIAKVTTCRACIDVQVINVETAEIISAETGLGTSSAILHYDARKALAQKDAELWVSEALRSASEDAALKVAKVLH